MVKANKLRKDDDAEFETQATEAAGKLDLSTLDTIVDYAPEILAIMADDAGSRALAQLGVHNQGDLVNQVYDNSVDYAKQRSAELVGKKWVNGVLVDNPAAEWSISEATRNELRVIIAEAFAGNIPADQVENAILEAGSFSPERAALIARTEISRANNYGALSGYVTARDKTGIVLQKAWHPDLEACPICVINADTGPIDLEDEFPSGDLAPPAHPNCECSLIPVTGGDE